jgi:hypothetical protein
MSYQDRKELYDIVKNLPLEHIAVVLEIIQLQKELYSENRNGTFVDLAQLSDDTVKLLQKYLTKRHESD